MRIWSLLFVALLLSLAPGATADEAEWPHVKVLNAAMNADFEFIIYGNSRDADREYLREIGHAAFAAVEALNEKINYWKPNSEVSRVNREAADAPVKVGDTLFSLLKFCQRVYQESEGAFDPTVGPLLEVWGFYRKQGHLPSTAELAAARKKVGFDKVILDDTAHTVKFTTPGVRLDLGGIGKGLALDRAANVLRDRGVRHALLSAGTSSVVAIGAPPGKPGWTVKIRDPYNKDASIEELLIADASLSTSGGYENFFELEGKKYCHLFDPRTGMPVEGVLTVSVIAPTGTESDAFTKVFFVGGADGARKFCAARPEVRGIVVQETAAGRPQITRINLEEAGVQQ